MKQIRWLYEFSCLSEYTRPVYLLLYSRIKIAMADTEIQLLEQEKLIEQLKSMIRERDEAFQQKEKELQVSLGIIYLNLY